MATFFLGLATFYLGLATFFLGMATFFLGFWFFQFGNILVPDQSKSRQFLSHNGIMNFKAK